MSRHGRGPSAPIPAPSAAFPWIASTGFSAKRIYGPGTALQQPLCRRNGFRDPGSCYFLQGCLPQPGGPEAGPGGDDGEYVFSCIPMPGLRLFAKEMRLLQQEDERALAEFQSRQQELRHLEASAAGTPRSFRRSKIADRSGSFSGIKTPAGPPAQTGEPAFQIQALDRSRLSATSARLGSGLAPARPCRSLRASRALFAWGGD